MKANLRKLISFTLILLLFSNSFSVGITTYKINAGPDTLGDSNTLTYVSSKYDPTVSLQTKILGENLSVEDMPESTNIIFANRFNAILNYAKPLKVAKANFELKQDIAKNAGRVYVPRLYEDYVIDIDGVLPAMLLAKDLEGFNANSDNEIPEGADLVPLYLTRMTEGVYPGGEFVNFGGEDFKIDNANFNILPTSSTTTKNVTELPDNKSVNSIYFYSLVPHVLGTEGTADYFKGVQVPLPDMNGKPTKGYVDDTTENTGLKAIYTSPMGTTKDLSILQELDYALVETGSPLLISSCVLAEDTFRFQRNASYDLMTMVKKNSGYTDNTNYLANSPFTSYNDLKELNNFMYIGTFIGGDGQSYLTSKELLDPKLNDGAVAGDKDGSFYFKGSEFVRNYQSDNSTAFFNFNIRTTPIEVIKYDKLGNPYTFTTYKTTVDSLEGGTDQESFDVAVDSINTAQTSKAAGTYRYLGYDRSLMLKRNPLGPNYTVNGLTNKDTFYLDSSKSYSEIDQMIPFPWVKDWEQSKLGLTDEEFTQLNLVASELVTNVGLNNLYKERTTGGPTQIEFSKFNGNFFKFRDTNYKSVDAGIYINLIEYTLMEQPEALLGLLANGLNSGISDAPYYLGVNSLYTDINGKNYTTNLTKDTMEMYLRDLVSEYNKRIVQPLGQPEKYPRDSRELVSMLMSQEEWRIGIAELFFSLYTVDALPTSYSQGEFTANRANNIDNVHTLRVGRYTPKSNLYLLNDDNSLGLTDTDFLENMIFASYNTQGIAQGIDPTADIDLDINATEMELASRYGDIQKNYGVLLYEIPLELHGVDLSANWELLTEDNLIQPGEPLYKGKEYAVRLIMGFHPGEFIADELKVGDKGFASVRAPNVGITTDIYSIYDDTFVETNDDSNIVTSALNLIGYQLELLPLGGVFTKGNHLYGERIQGNYDVANKVYTQPKHYLYQGIFEIDDEGIKYSIKDKSIFEYSSDNTADANLIDYELVKSNAIVTSDVLTTFKTHLNNDTLKGIGMVFNIKNNDAYSSIPDYNPNFYLGDDKASIVKGFESIPKDIVNRDFNKPDYPSDTTLTQEEKKLISVYKKDTNFETNIAKSILEDSEGLLEYPPIEEGIDYTIISYISRDEEIDMGWLATNAEPIVNYEMHMWDQLGVDAQNKDSLYDTSIGATNDQLRNYKVADKTELMDLTKITLDKNSKFYNQDYANAGYTLDEVTSDDTAEWDYLLFCPFRSGMLLEYRGDIHVPTKLETQNNAIYKSTLVPEDFEYWAVVTHFNYKDDNTKIDDINTIKINDYAKANFKIAKANLHVSSYTYPIIDGDNLTAQQSDDIECKELDENPLNVAISPNSAELPVPSGVFSFNPTKENMGLYILNYVTSDGQKEVVDLNITDLKLKTQKADISIFTEFNPNKPKDFMDANLIEEVEGTLVGFTIDTQSKYYKEVFSKHYISPYVSNTDLGPFNFVKHGTFDKGITAIYGSKFKVSKEDTTNFNGLEIYSFIESDKTVDFEASNTILSDDFSEILLELELELGYNIVNGDEAHSLNGNVITLFKLNENGTFVQATAPTVAPGERVKLRSYVGKDEITGEMETINYKIGEIKNFAFSQSSTTPSDIYPNDKSEYLEDKILLDEYSKVTAIEESELVGIQINPASEFYQKGYSGNKVLVMKETQPTLFNTMLTRDFAKGVNLLFDYEYTIPIGVANHSVTTDIGLAHPTELYQGFPDLKVDNKAKFVFDIQNDLKNLRIDKINVRDSSGLLVTIITDQGLSGYTVNYDLNLTIGENYYFEPVIVYDAPFSDKNMKTSASNIKLESIVYPSDSGSTTGLLSADYVSGQADYAGQLSDGDELEYEISPNNRNVLDFAFSEVTTAIPNLTDFYIDGGNELSIFGIDGSYDGYTFKFKIPSMYNGLDNGIFQQVGDWDEARINIHFGEMVDYSIEFGEVYDGNGEVYTQLTSSSYVDNAINVQYDEITEGNEPFYLPIHIEQLTSIGELSDVGIELKLYKFEGDVGGGSVDPYALDALENPVVSSVIKLTGEMLTGLGDSIDYDYEIPSSISGAGAQLACVVNLLYKPEGISNYVDLIDANLENNRDNIGISNYYNYFVSNLEVTEFETNIPEEGLLQNISAKSTTTLEGGSTSTSELIAVQVKYSILGHPDNPEPILREVNIPSGGVSVESFVTFEGIQTYPNTTYRIQVEVNPVLDATGEREYFENRYLDNIQEKELELQALGYVDCIPCETGGNDGGITKADQTYLNKIKGYPVLSDFEDNAQTTTKMTYAEYYRAVTGLDFASTFASTKYGGQMRRWSTVNDGALYVFDRNTTNVSVYFGHYENRENHTSNETSGHTESGTRTVGRAPNKHTVPYSRHVCDTKSHSRSVTLDSRSVSVRGTGTSFEKRRCVSPTTKSFGPYTQEFYERLMISQARSYSYSRSSEKEVNLVGTQVANYTNGSSTIFEAQRGSFLSLEFDVIYETNRKLGAIKSMANNYYARTDIASNYPFDPNVGRLDFFGSAATQGATGFQKNSPNESNHITENLEIFQSFPLEGKTVYWGDGRKSGDSLYSSIFNDYNNQYSDYNNSSYSWSNKAADNMWIWWGMPSKTTWTTPQDGYTDGPCTGTCGDCTTRAPKQSHSQTYYSKSRLEVGTVNVGKSGMGTSAVTSFSSYMEPDWKYDPDCEYVSLDFDYYGRAQYAGINGNPTTSPISAPITLYFIPQSSNWADDFGLTPGEAYSLPVTRIQKAGDDSFQKYTFALKKGQNNAGYFLEAEDVLDSPSYDPWSESRSSDRFYGVNDVVGAGEEYKYPISEDASGIYEFDLQTDLSFQGIYDRDRDRWTAPGDGLWSQVCRTGLKGKISGIPPVHYEKFD